jgi:hypothetical protein
MKYVHSSGRCHDSYFVNSSWLAVRSFDRRSFRCPGGIVIQTDPVQMFGGERRLGGVLIQLRIATRTNVPLQAAKRSPCGPRSPKVKFHRKSKSICPRSLIVLVNVADWANRSSPSLLPSACDSSFVGIAGLTLCICLALPSLTICGDPRQTTDGL